MDFTPYPWQENCLRDWISAGYRGIADVVTGAGKTALAMLAIQELRRTVPVPLSVFVVVPTCALQDQWVRELRRFFPEQQKIGRIGGGVICDVSIPFQVYVVNSARSLLPVRRNRLLSAERAVLLIADECHHYGAKENRTIFSGILSGAEHYFTLGLSSTPESNWFHDVLVPCLGPVITHYDHTAALSDRIVSSFCIQHISVSFTAAELGQYTQLSDRIAALHRNLMKEHPFLQGLDSASFFRELGELEAEQDSVAVAYNCLLRKRREEVCLADSRIQCAIDLIDQISSSARIIIFCERISQADTVFRQVILKFPHQVSIYHSALDSRMNRAAIRNFRDGDTRILITCKALDEGIDVPAADVAVVLSCSTVQRQRIQRLGRILRKGTVWKNAILYYLYIRESSEECFYLPFDSDQIPYMYYRYLPCDHTFFCPAFDSLLCSVLDKCRGKNATQNQTDEVIRLATRGMMRADWQRAPDTCRLLQDNEPQHENYWRVMRWLSEERDQH